MSIVVLRAAGLCLLTVLPMVWGGNPASAQLVDGQLEDAATPRSPLRAAALSMVLPGLGQRYVNGGSWKGSATLFALTDVALWVGLLRTTQARNQRIDSYEALAVARADADVDGKDRTFFLNLATYRSSDEYLDSHLRNRTWDELDYVARPGYQWDWTSDEDFRRFRELRDDAETLDRRTSILVATLVANRLLATVIAVRAAGRANKARTELAFTPPAAGGDLPGFRVSLQL